MYLSNVVDLIDVKLIKLRNEEPHIEFYLKIWVLPDEENNFDTTTHFDLLRDSSLNREDTIKITIEHLKESIRKLEGEKPDVIF